MAKTARTRLEKIESSSAYASEQGLMLIQISRRAPDGELISLTITDMPHVEPRGQAVSASIYFDVRSEHARFWEEYEKEDGGRSGIGEELPIDFSESYRVQDIWSGSFDGEDRPWREFETPEGLIDFLADRLLARD